MQREKEALSPLSVVSFTEPELKIPRTSFLVWPQHMVIVPSFYAQQQIALEAMREAASRIPVVKVMAGHIEYTQETEQEVIVFEPESLLKPLHLAVIEEMKKRSLQWDEQDSPMAFRPQIEVHKSKFRHHPEIAIGQLVTLDHFALVKSRAGGPDSPFKTIVDIAPFKVPPYYEEPQK